MKELRLAVGDGDLFIYDTVLPVTVSHLNYGNHLGHDALLSLLQEARMQLLAQEGMSEIALSDQVGYLVNQVCVDYRAQAHYGDALNVQIYAERFSKRSRVFSLRYRVTRQSDGAVIADAATRHAFFDYATKKITRAPKDFYWLVHRNLALITCAA